jgi:hypothetical protein
VGQERKVDPGKREDMEIAERALKIREEMIRIFEDLKHDPYNQELLALFHEKCEEFNELLKKVNEQYDEMHTVAGTFKTKN